MSALGEFVRLEGLLQARSLRARGAVAVYLAAAAVPALLAARAQNGELLLGSSTYVADVMTFLTPLSAALAAALTIDGVVRDRRSGAWSVLTLMPMSSAGYLLRRWAALLVLLLPLSAVPLAVALGVAAAQGAAIGPLSNVLVPWLLRVVPVVVGVSAAALGAGTLTDGIVPAVILLVTLNAVLPAVLNKALAPLRRHASFDAAEWVNPELAQLRFFYYRLAMRADRIDGLRSVIPASEAPVPIGAFAGAVAGYAALPFAGCLGLLGLSAVFLRRTTPDLAPWRPRPNHPLATLLAFAARLRPRLARDPRPEAPDRRLLLAAALSVLAALGFYWLRDLHYRSIMEATHRLQVEGWPAPTPRALEPRRATLRLRIGEDGSVAADSDLTLHNRGAEPAGHLSLVLLDGMELAELRPASGTLTIERRLDRLAIELDPPLAPGESRALHASTRGRPERVELALRSPGAPFELRYRLQAHADGPDLRDLARSYTRAAALPQRVDLGWQDVAPLPRYASWALTPSAALAGGGLDIVPGESAPPRPELAVEITAPARVLLGEACGGSGNGVARGACRMPLGEWIVAGGRLEPVRGLPLVFGVLPAHRAAAERLGEELGTLPELVRSAWPGRAATTPVLLEQSPPWRGDPRWGIANWSSYEERGQRFAGAQSAGNLVRIPEAWLVRDRRLPAAELVASSVVQSLLAQRTLAPNDQPAIEGLLREVVFTRLGRATPGGATLASRRLTLSSFSVSLRDASEREYGSWDQRLTAVTRELLARAGADAVERGLDRFFARGEGAAAPGDLPELLTTIGAEAGVDLATLLRDGFEQGALPQLALADVHAERQGDDYLVSGRVTNEGTGEAHCPLTVTTAAGSVGARVVVAGGASATFSVTTSAAPQTLLLDPDSTCFRWQPEPAGVLLEKVDLEAELAGAR